MAAGILLYGVALTDSDAEWAKFFDSHGCELRTATKAIAQRKGVKVKHPVFGCTVVGRPWWWFVTITASYVLAVGQDAVPVGSLKVQREWDESLRQFCDLFDLGKRQPAWYVTWLDDREHRGRKLVVS